MSERLVHHKMKFGEHSYLPETVYMLQPRQASTRPIEDGPSPHGTRDNNSAWFDPTLYSRGSFPRPSTHAALHRPSDQPKGKHASPGF